MLTIMVTFDRGENQTIRLAVSDRSSGRLFFNYFFLEKSNKKELLQKSVFQSSGCTNHLHFVTLILSINKMVFFQCLKRSNRFQHKKNLLTYLSSPFSREGIRAQT